MKRAKGRDVRPHLGDPNVPIFGVMCQKPRNNIPTVVYCSGQHSGNDPVYRGGRQLAAGESPQRVSVGTPIGVTSGRNARPLGSSMKRGKGHDVRPHFGGLDDMPYGRNDRPLGSSMKRDKERDIPTHLGDLDVHKSVSRMNDSEFSLLKSSVAERPVFGHCPRVLGWSLFSIWGAPRLGHHLAFRSQCPAMANPHC